jgi:Flp pilus assembly protein TadD
VNPGLHRAVLATGVAALLLAFLAGAVQSLRSERRVPAANLLLDGPAEHVENLLRSERYDDAVRQLRLYEELSNDRLPHERLATALSGLGPDARRRMAQALRDHPGYARGHYQLGLAFLGADEYEAARGELEAALRVRPDDPEAHNALGVVLAYQGRLEDAAAHFGAALSLRPDYAEARLNLARIESVMNSAPAGTE